MTTRVLADGNEIPLLGLGVWQVPNGPGVRAARSAGRSSSATATSTRRRPTATRRASAARCATAACRATRSSSRPSSIPAREDPEAEAQRSLERLGVDHVDLYIIHWPQGGPTWAWPGMERARAARLRALDRRLELQRGASSTSCSRSPRAGRSSTRSSSARSSTGARCSRRARSAASRSRPTARSAPAATSPTERVGEIAERVGRTPAQVLLRWCVQRDLIVIPKSTHRERIEENAQIFDFALSDEDMAALDALDETGGTERSNEEPWW